MILADEELYEKVRKQGYIKDRLYCPYCGTSLIPSLYYKNHYHCTCDPGINFMWTKSGGCSKFLNGIDIGYHQPKAAINSAESKEGFLEGIWFDKEFKNYRFTIFKRTYWYDLMRSRPFYQYIPSFYHKRTGKELNFIVNYRLNLISIAFYKIYKKPGLLKEMNFNGIINKILFFKYYFIWKYM